MSNPPAIQLENLSKTYGRGKQAVQALKNVNLQVPPGLVFGFLGPNGAGKTTTIRILMDLIRPTQGTARIHGKSSRSNPEVFSRVGAMVESPNFYEYLNGFDNLSVLARTANLYDPKRLNDILAYVGLADKAHRPVSGYSMGMKQRLGIAAALLGNPDLVLLDEPTNGLDPAGIQEMRGLIRNLAEKFGKTVFVSSHLLHEVEQICDQVAIINQGEVVQQGSVKELLSNGKSELRLLVKPLDKALEIISGKIPHRIEEEWIITTVPPKQVPTLVRHFVDQGLEVHQVVQSRQTLEEFFISVTGGKNG
jgi:ABC-2 type transport system ATP-binding protein